MGNYKIVNITNKLDKRNPNFNSILVLEYTENMIKKSISIGPDQEVVMSLNSLPQNISQMKMKKLIIVDEINGYQVNKILIKQKPILSSTVSHNFIKKNPK